MSLQFNEAAAGKERKGTERPLPSLISSASGLGDGANDRPGLAPLAYQTCCSLHQNMPNILLN